MGSDPTPDDKRIRWLGSDNQRVAVITSIAAIISALITGTVTFLVTRDSPPTNNPTATGATQPSASPDPSRPTYTPTYILPSQVAASPSLSPDQSVSSSQYTVGMCFNFTTGLENSQAIYYADCSSPHRGQIAALLNASGGPSIQAADGVMGTDCGYIVNSLDQATATQATSYLQTPPNDGFTTGYRGYSCFAETSDPVSTSLITW